MSYRIYIKKDYRPEIRWISEVPWYRRSRTWLTTLLAGLVGIAFYSSSVYTSGRPADSLTLAPPPALPAPEAVIPGAAPQPGTGPEAAAGVTTDVTVSSPRPLPAPPELPPWDTIRIRPGDSLSLVFDRAGLSPAVLQQVMLAGPETGMLRRLMPGEEIRLQIDAGTLRQLAYAPDPATTLHVSRHQDGFASRLSVIPLQTRLRDVSAIIEDSLFLAGQNAGLSDNLIMRFVAIYGWDIDFALDIRSGDRFRVIYEEQYKEGVKVSDGNIIAAEFINRNQVHRAVRYTSPDGTSGYYDEQGYSMRKAFLRTPVKFSRISSGFSLHRKHPLLNTIRAHRGVDYAAPTGTEVKATGDGTVVFVGVNGGYGKTITIRHAGIYRTVYAHLSRFARGLKRGQRVRQGEIIGYVGMTGLATGPHLHYEFQVNGVHQNPLKVKLPKSFRIPEQQMADFQTRTAPLLARLDSSPAEHLVLAQSAAGDPETSVH